MNMSKETSEYRINNKLNKKDVQTGVEINLCVYLISTIGKCDTIYYLLYKYPENDILTFPRINDISVLNKFLDNISEYKTDVKGYYVHDGEIYLFISASYKSVEDSNVKSYILNNDVCKRDNIWWWAIIDEIVNVRMIFEFEIHNSVTDLFLKNNWLSFLYDMNGDVLKHPSIMYLGDHYNNVVFQSAFGLYRKSLWNKLGPFYVFTDYKNAVKNALETSYRSTDSYLENSNIYIDNTMKHTKGGIIRCIIFGDVLKLFLNSKNDEDNGTLIKGNNEKSNILDEKRMNDQNGRWTKKYDMAMLGNPILNSGNRFDGKTRTSIYDQNNCILLNYVEIDIKTKKIMN
tara:strand:- start:3950 stop:4984 length:1035 start_codon:yes stop_codon:yes gene_type:complete